MATPLKLSTLRATTDSKLIGNFHRQLLKEKFTEFNELLQQRKSELDLEVSVYPHHTLAHSESSEEDVQKSHQQLELDKLYNMYQERLDQLFRKFEREWRNDPRPKPIEISPPKEGLESVYLSQTLGDALRRALAELCQTRPADPIEYLATWLRQYAQARVDQKQAAVEDFKLQLLQEEQTRATDTQELMTRERRQIRQEEQRRREIFLARSKQISERQQTPEEAEQTTPEVQEDGQTTNASENPSSDVTENPTAVEPTSGSSKRVTVKESENSLYTIEEKDNESNNSSGAIVAASEEVAEDGDER